MKKFISVFYIILVTLTVTFSQNSQKESPNSDDIGNQMAQMQKQLAEQMKKMFGNGNDSDSTENFGFSLKNMPFQMDTSMMQSFGMMFDGKNWHNLSPNGDTTLNESLRGFQGQMPDFGKGFNLDDMLKGFGSMFKDGFPMSPNTDGMPLIQPYDKQRKGDEPKKKGKYKTESL